MAGVSVGESPDNPVAINVTAMVDVIFCLCVFFMCSLHFRQLEGKFETWLPKGKGDKGGLVDQTALSEMRVAMFWDDAKQTTVRQFGQRYVATDDELQGLIKAAPGTRVVCVLSGGNVNLDQLKGLRWN